MKIQSRKTKFRMFPWVAYNGRSVYFKAGLCVSWLGREFEAHWGGLDEEMRR